MRCCDEVLGVVSIQSYREMAYDAIDLQLMQDLANHCGPAVVRIWDRNEIAEEGSRYSVAGSK
jgi:hypothetical protein